MTDRKLPRRAVVLSMFASTALAACGGGVSPPASIGSPSDSSSSSTSTGSASSSSPSNASSSSSSTASTQKRIICWGDSLTSGTGGTSFPAQLGAILPNTTVTNSGIGGQTSTQIAGRQGGVQSVLTLSSNQILATNNLVSAINAVPIIGHTTTQDPDYRLISTAATNNTLSLSGSISGVSGKLTSKSSGGPPSTTLTYSFTPDADPGVVVLSGPTLFAIPQPPADSITIIWAGRNNYSHPAEVKSDIAKMISSLPNTQFIVLSVMNGDYPGYEYTGQAGWSLITQLNQDLHHLYPDNFIDVRAVLVAEGAPGGKYADSVFYPRDVIPAALRSDSIHLTTSGYGLVAAQVATFISLQGW